MIEVLQLDFMRNAIAAGILSGVICGILGTLIVVNRIVFISGGIAHSAYGGIGIALYFGLPYLIGTLGFSLAVSVIMAAVTLKDRHRSDTVIGVLWAVGMALGVLLIDMTPGYNVDLMSYLFGSILTVLSSDIWLMAGLCVAMTLIVYFFYNGFLSMAYDEEFARTRGVSVGFLHILLLCMTGFSVVMIIRVVGLILVIALLTIAPYIAERYARSIFWMMVISIALNILFIITGLWLSYTFNLTSGATIIMTGGAVFFISILFDRLRIKI